MKTRLFVDMDGTLAVFRKHITNLEALYEPGYFRSLLPNPNVVEAIKEIIKGHSDEVEVFVCSAYLTDSKYAFAEKQEWLDEHLPEIDAAHRVLMPCGENKAKHIPCGIQNSDFLFDDLTKNLRDFQEAGGKSLKLWNGINGSNGTYRGDCVSYLNSPEALSDKILRVLLYHKPVRDKRPQDIHHGMSEKRVLQLYYTAIRNEHGQDAVRFANILYEDFAKVAREPLQERDFEMVNVSYDNVCPSGNGARTVDVECTVRGQKHNLSYTFDTDGSIVSQNIPDDMYLLMSPQINRTIAKCVHEFADQQKAKTFEPNLEDVEK